MSDSSPIYEGEGATTPENDLNSVSAFFFRMNNFFFFL